MTTSVKVHVNGKYRATVVQTMQDGTQREPVVVEGNYDGSPNPSGAYTFHLAHPVDNTFKITEEQVIDEPKKDLPESIQNKVRNED